MAYSTAFRWKHSESGDIAWTWAALSVGTVWSVRSVTLRFPIQSIDSIFDHDLKSSYVSGSWTRKTLCTSVSMLLVSYSQSNTHMSFDYKYHLHIFHLSFIVLILYPEVSFFLSFHILCVRHFSSHNFSVTCGQWYYSRVWWNSLSFLLFENVIHADNIFWMYFFPFNSSLTTTHSIFHSEMHVLICKSPTPLILLVCTWV